MLFLSLQQLSSIILYFISTLILITYRLTTGLDTTSDETTTLSTIPRRVRTTLLSLFVSNFATNTAHDILQF